MTLGININCHSVLLSYCYAECHYAECRGVPFEGRARGLNQKYEAWLKNCALAQTP
jgi:hypothetical protein